ncbi:DUF2520 domain-containing protein [Aquihabitans sp. McL0605]|uniref:DUF2520 domain-containing protein n=1 Tax=Aquihabitans sp. McL0605 TaxID=3415671 RepID=UPI003CF03174
MTVAPRLRIVGPGRAGRSLGSALQRAGWQVVGLLGRDDDLRGAGAGADLVLITTPDAVIAEVAAAIEPTPQPVIAHAAGSLGLDVLAGHPRTAAIHPLVALPDPERGAERLFGSWFALAGDPIVQRAAADLGGRWFEVADQDRAAYHAAAVVASNHLVALMGQVERIAGGIGVPGEAYLHLAAGALQNVAEVGPAAALTGPAARGDWATIARHLDAIDPSERPAYLALAAAARRLVDDDGLPPELTGR